MLVVPTVLREKAISLAHEGHQGLVKTKHLLREKVWFPGIDQLAKRTIETCLTCLANNPDNCPAPLQMSPLPPTPWHTLHADFCGPFPTGEYLCVVIDAYSRFSEVDIVRSTSAATIIPCLDRILARTASQQSSALTTVRLSRATSSGRIWKKAAFSTRERPRSGHKQTPKLRVS